MHPPAYTAEHLWSEAAEAFREASSPSLNALYLAATHRVHVFPVHGMRRAETDTGVECECLKNERARAEREGSAAKPCAQPGKRPRILDWPNTATVDPVMIARWSRQWPLTNFSAVTGSRSKCWVLDLDGDLGFASFSELLQTHGPLPPTWTTKSGSGKGAHYWFKLPPGVTIRNSVSALAPGIDVRGEAGQIVLPGSLHRSGRRYRWLEGCTPTDLELGEAPAAWIDLALNACKKTQTTKVSTNMPLGRARQRSTSASHHSHPNSLLIGDGAGRGGFRSPINRLAIRYFRDYGGGADPSILKAALRREIVEAPATNHEPWDIERYASDVYLDDAIESARAYISKRSP